jgi:preprotein translocase subunit SecE
MGLAGKLVAPSWQEAVNTTLAVLASIVALSVLVTAIDSFWLATYRVRLQLS